MPWTHELQRPGEHRAGRAARTILKRQIRAGRSASDQIGSAARTAMAASCDAFSSCSDRLAPVAHTDSPHRFRLRLEGVRSVRLGAQITQIGTISPGCRSSGEVGPYARATPPGGSNSQSLGALPENAHFWGLLNTFRSGPTGPLAVQFRPRAVPCWSQPQGVLEARSARHRPSCSPAPASS